MHSHNTTDVNSTHAPRALGPDQREPWPSFLRAMFAIGLNTFGGPVAQIGVMHAEVVEKRRWLNDGEFTHLLNFANLLPGPEALEIAIHIGYLRRGLLGGIVAGILFIWPGVVSLTLLAWLYAHYGKQPLLSGFLSGIRPVAVALIAYAAVRLSIKSLKGWHAYALMLAAYVANCILGVPFVPLLLGCGFVGIGLSQNRTWTARQVPQRGIVIVVVAALALGLWMHSTSIRRDVSFLDNGNVALTKGTYGEIAWVNTKAALLTFGGAYTVMPFLREQMVSKYGWVSDVHIADALALGETTPGPLVSVGVYLSYLAGGFWGAMVSSLCLFLPSFIFVLSLGRYIERIENWPHAQRFLWGVSAGTIGLILSMSAQMIPMSIQSAVDLLIAFCAFFALWKMRAHVIATVLVGGFIGLLRTLN